MKHPTNRRSKNHWMIQFRKWHSWLGAGLSAVILMLAITGIYLNHKDFFNRLARGDWSWPLLSSATYAGPQETTAVGHDQFLKLTTRTDLGKLPITFAQAIEAAREHLGEVDLEKIELKSEKGSLIYKIKATDERELTIDLASGKGLLREKKNKEVKPEGGLEKPKDQTRQQDKEKSSQHSAMPRGGGHALGVRPSSTQLRDGVDQDADGTSQLSALANRKEGPSRDLGSGGGIVVRKVGEGSYRQADGSLNWPKILKDAHTGKLLGAFWGKLLVDFAALVIIGLTLSGLYLWWVPLWRKWVARREKQGKPAFVEWNRANQPAAAMAANGSAAQR